MISNKTLPWEIFQTKRLKQPKSGFLLFDMFLTCFSKDAMKIPVDLLIEARWIIPVEPAGLTLEHHALVIDQGKIVALLAQKEAREAYAPRQTKKLTDHLLIPGLVNLHTHAAMSLLRGVADDLPLKEWLDKHIWPAEAKHADEQFVYDGSLIACAEMLKSGITCFNDMYYHPRQTTKAALALGMRAAIGLIVIDFPTGYASDADDYLAKGMALRDEFKDESLISFCMAPHAPYTVNDKNLSKVLTLAEQCDLPIHIHVNETRLEIEESLNHHGITPIERLHQLGMLSPALTGVHATHVSEHEIELLAKYGCSIAHCPSSNLKLGGGIAPVASLLDAKINVGLGTDGAASNNRLDILQEMRLAALLAKGSTGRPEVLNAHQTLYMATLAGAKALGLDQKIGSIAVGKSADLVAFDFKQIGMSPCYDPASHLTYTLGRESVSNVWIEGKCCIDNNKISCVNEIELINLAALWQNRIYPRVV